MTENTDQRDLEKAALRGEPSYVWRDGQARRLGMILDAVGERITGKTLEDGCGVGMYVQKMAAHGGWVFGLEYEFERAVEAGARSSLIICAAGEELPYPSNHFDVILSHEVIEHVRDDKLAVREMVRVLKPGGRLVLFCPNRWYPVETHGVFWRGRYKFGNIPLVNYLPDFLRSRLAPHVRVYTQWGLGLLFAGLPVRFVTQTIVFGAYDNIIARWPGLGRLLRQTLQLIEKTPLQVLGLSHFWVVEKKDE